MIPGSTYYPDSAGKRGGKTALSFLEGRRGGGCQGRTAIPVINAECMCQVSEQIEVQAKGKKKKREGAERELDNSARSGRCRGKKRGK